jgi:hypothetical protein
MSFGPAQDELTRRIIDGRLADVHTSAPGTVVKFYSDDYTVDVKLGAQKPVARYDGGVSYEEHPILPRVPVCSFGTVRTYNRPDLEPGDLVWVLFSETSPAEFLEEGNPSQPGDTARHSLSGGLAIPITIPGKLPATPKTVLGGVPASPVAIASLVESAIASLQTRVINMAAAGNSGGPLVFTPVEDLSVGAQEVWAK